MVIPFTALLKMSGMECYPVGKESSTIYGQNKFVMVTQETNWADEMDVFGFSIMFQDEWNEHIDYAKKYFEKKDTFYASLGNQ